MLTERADPRVSITISHSRGELHGERRVGQQGSGAELLGLASLCSDFFWLTDSWWEGRTWPVHDNCGDRDGQCSYSGVSC